MNWLQYLATALSLIGLCLNIRKCRWCFAVWFLSNALWAGWGALYGAWGLLLTQVCFAAFGVWGFVRWSREEQAR